MNKTEEPSAWTIIILYELLKHIVDENNKRLKLQRWKGPRPAHRRPVASERQGTVSNMHLKR